MASTTTGPTEEQKLRSLEQARLAAKIADEFKGRDTVILDLTGITPLFDFFVITTGSSNRQMHAVAEEVDRALNEAGSERRGIEGYRESQWIVQDYGDIVLHVMTIEAREAYDLEGLWADAKRVEWSTDEAIDR
jgi:ribosome-associated protein